MSVYPSLYLSVCISLVVYVTETNARTDVTIETREVLHMVRRNHQDLPRTPVGTFYLAYVRGRRRRSHTLLLLLLPTPYSLTPISLLLLQHQSTLLFLLFLLLFFTISPLVISHLFPSTGVVQSAFPSYV